MSKHIKNILGELHGRLEVVHYYGVDTRRRALWICRCSCGNYLVSSGTQITSGAKKSCGCLQEEKCRLSNIDFSLINKRFGKLLVVELIKTSDSKYRFLCKCDCGNTRIIKGSYLTTGHYTNCGCSKHAPRVDNKEAILRRMFTAYKRNAGYKQFEFNLSETEFIHFTSLPCYYCGEIDSREQDNTHGRKVGKFKDHYKVEEINGVDRIDSSKGYFIGNVVPCCSMCNRMKCNFTTECFFDKIEKIYNRHVK